MYDYATSSKQTQIIEQADEINDNLYTLNETIKNFGTTIILIILIIAFKNFVVKILGGKY